MSNRARGNNIFQQYNFAAFDIVKIKADELKFSCMIANILRVTSPQDLIQVMINSEDRILHTSKKSRLPQIRKLWLPQANVKLFERKIYEIMLIDRL